MLYRFSVVLLLTLLVVPAAISAPSVERAMDHAQQSNRDMRSHTSKVLEEAEALSTLPEFLDSVNQEAAKALLGADKHPTQLIPSFPELTDKQLQQARTDINQLLDQAQTQTEPAPQGQKTGPQLYVFVSTSMPDITLKRLLIQASRIDGSLILRGLVDGDMQKTKNKVMQLLETDASGNTQIDGGLSIDPTLFERFDISQVPSFVVTNTPAERCNKMDCPSTDYARLSGDTTLEYALETIAREAPAMRESAQTILKRMTGGL